jgi:hypothetical protein
MAVNHVTTEAQRWIEQADVVLCVDLDPVAERWTRKLNEHVESRDGRGDTDADAISQQTLEHVRARRSVAAVYDGYGALSGHSYGELIRQMRAEGYRAVVLPSISPADTLFADLVVDPWRDGVQLFDCTDFIRRGRRHRRTLSRASHYVKSLQHPSAAGTGRQAGYST